MLSVTAEKMLRELDFPASLPEGMEVRRIVETHVSLVIITEQYTFKLKKSVDLGFVNHLLVSQRWSSALNEILLNRRFAEQVYLGLIALSTPGEKLALEKLIADPEPGAVAPEDLAEVVVVMKTLSAERMLDVLIEKDSDSSVLERRVKQLSKRISDFHREQLENPLNRASLVGDFEKACLENIDLLSKRGKGILSDASMFALGEIEKRTRAFFSDPLVDLLARVNEGFFIDGHGDLRAEHVYFGEQGVSLIDCIEFSDSLRQVDVLNDLAFLRMDLDFLGRADLSQVLVDCYVDALPQVYKSSLLDFYSAYRAMVRAKVGFIAEEQQISSGGEPGLSTVSKHMALAFKYLALPSEPFVLMVGGSMGVGKSTLASFIGDVCGAALLQSDLLRKEVFGQSQAEKQAAFAAGKYSAEGRGLVYSRLLSLTEARLQRGESVILDASFAERVHREAVCKLATVHNASCLFVLCELDRAQQEKRLRKRELEGTSISDGRFGTLRPATRSLPKAQE